MWGYVVLLVLLMKGMRNGRINGELVLYDWEGSFYALYAYEDHIYSIPYSLPSILIEYNEFGKV